MHFHQAILDLPPGEAARDLGIALIELARRYPSAQGAIGPMALPMLEPAVQSWPEDAAAAEARGFALWLAGQPNQAMAAYKDLLERTPEREVALLDAAYFSASLGQSGDAIAYWRRVIKLDPWAARYHHQLALLLAGQQQWAEAMAECQTVLRLNPASPETRRLMVSCLLRTGKRGQAQSEFEKLLGLDPPEKEKLRRWFSEQMR